VLHKNNKKTQEKAPKKTGWPESPILL
jgi:hypothetical protein